MAKKMSDSNSDPSATNGSLPKGVLTRKEKLEAAKKANQAMMKAWKLIGQRKDRSANAEGAEGNF